MQVTSDSISRIYLFCPICGSNGNEGHKGHEHHRFDNSWPGVQRLLYHYQDGNIVVLIGLLIPYLLYSSFITMNPKNLYNFGKRLHCIFCGLKIGIHSHHPINELVARLNGVSSRSFDGSPEVITVGHVHQVLQSQRNLVDLGQLLQQPKIKSY